MGPFRVSGDDHGRDSALRIASGANDPDVMTRRKSAAGVAS
jgi:hypothetical protein